MKLAIGLLADYAAELLGGKLAISGIFDTILGTGDPKMPVAVPRMVVVVVMDAHLTEGSKHTVEIRLATSDGTDIFRLTGTDFMFRPRGPGLPLRGQVLVRLESSAPLPHAGEYAFHIFVDGADIGSFPLYAVIVPPSARPGTPVSQPPIGRP